MRVLITGSEGNIGAKLVPYLEKCGHEVFCVDIVQKYRENYVISDIRNPIDLLNHMKGFKPEVIIHLAAMVSRITCEKSATETISSNILGLTNIIELAKLYDSKLIYFSTSEVYGDIGGILSEDRTDLNPNNRYGFTKLMGEKLVEYEVKNNNLKSIILRPFMFYDEDENFGENRSAMIRFMEASITKDKKMQVHDKSSRNWTHISDAVILIEKSIHLQDFEIINISSSEVIDMVDFAHKVNKVSETSFDDIFEIIPQPPKMTLNKIPGVEKMEKLLRYSPKVSIDHGLELVFKKVKNRLSI